MKIPVAIKILNEATGPKANVEFMDVSICAEIRPSARACQFSFVGLWHSAVKPYESPVSGGETVNRAGPGVY